MFKDFSSEFLHKYICKIFTVQEVLHCIRVGAAALMGQSHVCAIKERMGGGEMEKQSLYHHYTYKVSLYAKKRNDVKSCSKCQ